MTVQLKLKREMLLSAAVLAGLAGLTGLLGACGGGGQPGDITPTVHPKVLVKDTATLGQLKKLLADKHTAATRFQAYVDRELASPGSTYAFAGWHAALMYQVTGQSKYADFAVAKIDAFVAAEEALIASGQRPKASFDSYLDVGPLVGDVALVYDWCNTLLTPEQRKRWVAYMNQAVANVWNPTGATWGGKAFPWSGWSVDNPSNNYYYSFLEATMLVGLATEGETTQSAQWRMQFRQSKIAAQLVPTFDRDLAGGGSREGTGYGTAMKNLFRLYDWWEKSTGERLATLTPHTQASQAWMLHAIVPSFDRLAAIGDQARDSSASLFDYHREYLMALGALFPQERLSGAVKTVLDSSSVPSIQSGFELWADYLYQPAGLVGTPLTNLATAYWGSGTGQLFMRASWTDKKAAYSSFTCGPFTESHAHNDQGAFQLYRGEWLAPTANIYTHSGIQQGAVFNNLVRVTQSGATLAQGLNTGCAMQALADNATFTYAVADVTPVYAGARAIKKVQREYLFIKPATFVVFDRVASDAGTQRVWTLNVPGSAVVSGDRLTVTAPGANKLDVFRVAPAGLAYQLSKPATLPDGDTWLDAQKVPTRVEVSDAAGTQSLFLHVLGTNGSVTSATRFDATGQTGVQIELADGRRVRVRFNEGSADKAIGGTLEVLPAGSGAAQFSGNLPAGVANWPLYQAGD